LIEGAKTVFADLHRRNAWCDSTKDELYQSIVKQALEFGSKPESA
jgi:hypothetical protein